MRLLVRIALLTSVLTVCLIWYAVSKAAKSDNSDDDIETDETVRILLMSDGEGSTSQHISVPELTFNVAIVLVISLLSVALLITGIIVVAVTLDPAITSNDSSDDEDECEETEKSDPHSEKKLFVPCIASPSGRLLQQFDNLLSIQEYTAPSVI
ncbi:hypothetical protein AB6A40_006974 [Gnathostoma spinigerum]|uniref:Transmembrane protein n=1 Tax=Gnathostoma spinigerum TaxID=75299 RepID=A0ABD6EVI8_9BILA